MSVQIGDIVGRKSYDCDLLFRVIDMKQKDEETIVMLYGEDVRLVADAFIDDLVVIDEREYKKRKQKLQEKEDQSFRLFRKEYKVVREKNEYTASSGYKHEHAIFQMPGKVLHLDGDPLYLKKCRMLYERLHIPAYGFHMNESEMPEKVEALIDQFRPDILVITGHDAYSESKGAVTELKAYRHSRYFVETVNRARKKIPNLDQLVIFAGACQSHFESLIRAGANFASSPRRVNIHALDPVYVVAKVSYTAFNGDVNVWEVLKNTLTGEKGLGGIQTRGFLRTGMPLMNHEKEEKSKSD
ncbi:sporulation peptidase YabG [Bacillus solimangrovi]|uniref:Sporulation peptidase YabG n=1 Tax=Bacillus solimangrovi TaxID=1305675 RepID=A0A1E5LEW5_9BACI|nr:sporulation peptidase YabG [Bacillus solimangrovi]OEH92624.1 sporulation peptidase YabG [Bacillus solimangrovi]